MENAGNGGKRRVPRQQPAPSGRDLTELNESLNRLRDDPQFRSLSAAHRYYVAEAWRKWGGGDGSFW
ncbi:MAG TPA: hypothetical protein VFU64_05270, partial [Gaiellaceae bacterium]|nr:hypothetical protein [Gaiellaceae bacterium]